MLNKAEMSQEKEENLGIDERNIFFQKLYNTPDDEPWMHSPELTSALHPLSGPTELSPTSHTKPISTLHWQAIQWGKRNVDGLWLEAFCSLSAVQWALALPDSWQDFVMEMCDGQNSTKTLFPALMCRNDFMVWVKTRDWVCVLGDSRVTVCVRYFMTGAAPWAHGSEFHLTEQPTNCSCCRLVSWALAIGS